MRRRASAACAAALVAACAVAGAGRAQAATAHPLLAAGEATHYLYPLGAAQREDEIVIGMAMLSMLAHKQDADGKCLSDACVHDRSDIYSEMALAYSRLGLHGLSLRLYRAAGQDLPDDADVHYNVGVELESTQQMEAAAREFARTAELSAGKDRKAEEGVARFYLLTDQLDLARTHFERCLLADGDPDLAQYCAIGLKLTKLHGGNDSLVPPTAPSAQWPGPLLSYQQKGDEAALAAAVAHTDDATKRRQRLCEALYYAGERELQSGRRELALRFFRAVVAQRVESFWEHFAATRRIEQLHGNDDPPPAPPPAPSHAPIG